ncbi:MFS general substrate transporter [Thozetella sp. PMI_491]|nr:MFS general substrate transporter [Thozetella sp. PMI_491]
MRSKRGAMDEEAPSRSRRSAPWLLKFRSSRDVILLTVCVAAFADGFMHSVFAPILPNLLLERYQVDDGDLQWWSSVLLSISSTAILLASPVVGWFSDAEGGGTYVYKEGLLYLIGSIMALFTDSLTLAVISRVLQGISSAIVFTVGLALVADTVDPSQIGYEMGSVMSSLNLGLLIGPLTGGLAFDAGGYTGVLTVMLAVYFANTFWTMLAIDKRQAHRYESPSDLAEYTTLLPSPITATGGTSTQRAATWNFVPLLRTPRIAAAIYGVFVHIVVVTGFDGVLSIYVEQIFDWSSFNVGLCFVTIGAANAFVGPFAGKLSDQCGARWLAFLGCVTTAIPVTLLRFVDTSSTGQAWLLYILLASIGAMSSFAVSPLAADLFAAAQQRDVEGEAVTYAQIYGLFSCAMASGALVGPIFAGYMKETFGWTAMAWGMGVSVASGAIPVYVYTGGRREG